MKVSFSAVVILLLLLTGLFLLLYPGCSNWWNSLHQSQAIVAYDDALEEMAQRDCSALFDAAREYNQQLAALDFPLMDCGQIGGYKDLLNVEGVMGHLTIPKLEISLPVCHGTEEAVLKQSVGHLEGTSLPTGEPGTHCALSAHRGLPSARLFTDLDKMEMGDRFTLTVLDREMTYQVDQILVVEPGEVEPLYAVAGEDLCTLITCTPYGINTHRLLVRGHRVAEEAGPETDAERSGALCSNG